MNLNVWEKVEFHKYFLNTKCYQRFAILKFYFALLLLNRKTNWLEPLYKVSGQLVDQK